MGLLKKLLKRKQKPSSGSSGSMQNTSVQNAPLQADLQENINQIQEALGYCPDIMVRKILINKRQTRAAIVFTDGLIDATAVENSILKPLMLDFPDNSSEEPPPSAAQDLMEFIRESVLTVGELQELTDLKGALDAVLSGNVVILADGYAQGFSVDMAGWEQRSVEEATTETAIRGPKEGFVEDIRINTALLRRKIKSPALRWETRIIGRVTKTNVAVMYIKGIVNEKILEEVFHRLDRIDIDGIMDSGYIEELIQDETFTPFPTVINSERPDVVAAALLEGRIAILVDGTPFVLMVPALFIQFFQAAEDYYHRSDVTSLIRLVRYLTFFITLLGPSFYIAITTFHQEMLPTPLLISLAAQREGVPFPAFIEAFIMEVAFEILFEAGIRLPRAVGQAVSIVGTLVLGTAAVDAGLVSAAMVIVVSLTAISSFLVPHFELNIATRMTRFVYMALAATFGLFGIIVGLLALVLHMCSLRSFGVPYMTPLAPFIPSEQKDTFIRVPRWRMYTRPILQAGQNKVRQQPPQKAEPKPPDKQ
ncbi:spore germination protein [Brevibacillus sp. B_LB10_24]|uniref:spore germination protein n=1 Tax=Brevibacillus sp. B_LB10_24 TaxID=3380645 RepID=UPI0038B72FE8